MYQARLGGAEAFDLNAVVSFGGFEPRAPSARKFYLTASAVSGYEVQQATGYIGPLPIPSYLTDLAGSSGTAFANMPLEAAVLTVRLRLANRVTRKIRDIQMPMVGWEAF